MNKIQGGNICCALCSVLRQRGGVVATYDVFAPRLAVRFKRRTFKSSRKVLAL